MSGQQKELPFKSVDVYHWPEFQALCKRLGIDWFVGTKSIVIELNSPNENVKVVQVVAPPDDSVAEAARKGFKGPLGDR